MPFIVFDSKDKTIWGTGETIADALTEAEKWVLSWIRSSVKVEKFSSSSVMLVNIPSDIPKELQAREATLNLVNKVKNHGVNVNEYHFRESDGIADLK
jgi:hypothetical protein